MLDVPLVELPLVILVEPVELELPMVLVDIVDVVDELLPEVVEDADVVLLPEVDEELPVLLALAMLELVIETTLLPLSRSNQAVSRLSTRAVQVMNSSSAANRASQEHLWYSSMIWEVVVESL